MINYLWIAVILIIFLCIRKNDKQRRQCGKY